MPFQGGVKAAAKMLAGLTTEARKKILEIIIKKDPQMYDALKKNMFTFEDLNLLSQTQWIELLRSIKTSDLGLALRVSSQEMKDFVFTNSPRGIRDEVQEALMGPPQLASKVEEAKERIMQIARDKIDKGQLVLRGDSDDPLV